jgi:ABC-2 type transport system permease protein
MAGKITLTMKKNLKGIYAIWYREFKVFTRERVRVVSSVVMPLMWYFIFGAGMSGVANVGKGVDYHHFIFPGFLVMMIIFSGLFNGAYIVWDKKIDFLKEVLIAPLSRTTIFFGKVAGCMTDALLQAFILLIVGVIIGIPFTPISVLLSIIMLVALAVGLVSIGLIMGSFMESPEAYGIISSVVVYPMFLLSGALYPLDKLPMWLKVLTRIDPASYAVDGLRDAIINTPHISDMPYLANLFVILGFDAVFILIGTWAFNRMKL